MNFSPAGNLLVALGAPVSCRLQFLNRQTLRKMKDVFLSNFAPDQHDWTRNEERSAAGWGITLQVATQIKFFFCRWECECDVKCCTSCHYDALLGSTFTLPICLFSFLRNFSVCNHLLQSGSLTQFCGLKHYSFLSLTHELQHLSLWIVLLDPSTVSTLRISFCFLCIIYI